MFSFQLTSAAASYTFPVAQGVPDVGSNDVSGVPAAATAAGAADLVILTIGSDLMLEQEGHDRTSIDFSAGQKTLITAVTAAATGPVIALVFGGGAMDVSSLLTNPKISAVFHVGQPSVQISAIGDLLFGMTKDGRSVSPAARMSQMIYPADYVNQVRTCVQCVLCRARSSASCRVGLKLFS